MHDKEIRLDELKRIIRNAEKEKNILEKEITAEQLMKLKGTYFMVCDDSSEYFMFDDDYNEKTQSIGCWRFSVTEDWNGYDSYIIEKIYFQSEGDLPYGMIRLSKEEFEVYLGEHLSTLEKIILNRGGE